MKISRKTIQTLLIILLSFSLYMVISEKNLIQKRVDENFIGAISDSMSGFSKDYSVLSEDEKIKTYYQTIYGLKNAQNNFHITSYKEHEDIFQALNGLYIYLLTYDHKNDDYEIEDKLYIYDTIWKIVGQPENEELVKEFNDFIENKKKLLNEKNTSQIKLPLTDNISSIEIAGGLKDTIITNKDMIEFFIQKVVEATPTSKQSIQDVPTVSEYTRVDFISSGNILSIFIYQDNSKWYIEQPYYGIYETNENILKLLKDY